MLWLASGGILASDAPPADWPEWLAPQALSPEETVSFDPETGEMFDVSRRRDNTTSRRRGGFSLMCPANGTHSRPPRSMLASATSARSRRDSARHDFRIASQRPLCSGWAATLFVVFPLRRTIGGLLEQMGFTVEEAGLQLYEAAKEAGRERPEERHKDYQVRSRIWEKSAFGHRERSNDQHGRCTRRAQRCC